MTYGAGIWPSVNTMQLKAQAGLLYDPPDNVGPADSALGMVGRDIGDEAAHDVAVRIQPFGGDGLDGIFLVLYPGLR
ncbi:hypothetical protein BN2476_1530019 [Paraburkholderia piptadeniae]|uniref:Uncharacterized protein n=1 Tax=Paraburkholderia piptadeniae TaxID=1701573 RepID=A0A1N7SY99_9BURK|nr:hypothetical protein BN2476_1530019 [Paraburkholderia piptadeniae]